MPMLRLEFILERNHRSAKGVASRITCSVPEAVHRYNVMSHGSLSATASANTSLIQYLWDTQSSRGYDPPQPPGISIHGDATSVFTLHCRSSGCVGGCVPLSPRNTEGKSRSDRLILGTEKTSLSTVCVFLRPVETCHQ